MRRLMLGTVLLAGAATLAACGGAAGSDADTRQVQVDYVHDEVASSFIAYFPREITMRPGDTVVFQQQWTGEPHSVTMGTMVDDMMEVVAPLIEEHGASEEPPPEDVMNAYMEAMAPLPEMGYEQEDGSFQVSQNAGQPCYLDSGAPPDDVDTPCSDEDQEQPPFNGRQSYYNSGFIPYEGESGNEFVVELAEDIEPGTYSYYCNLHGPFQSGTITVVEPGEEIPSAEDVARQAREEIDAMAEPLVAAYEEAPREGAGEVFGMTVEAPFSGWFAPGVEAMINEFIPEVIETQVGEPITWTFVGGHTVSFEVPEYFAQVIVDEEGAVRLSDEAIKPFNVPDPPAPPEGEGPPGEGPPPEDGAEEDEPGPDEEATSEGEGPPEGGGPPELPLWDVGSWDGEEFISSGVQGEIRFRMRFTEPGTYPYACLIHPQMVGSVKVN